MGYGLLVAHTSHLSIIHDVFEHHVNYCMTLRVFLPAVHAECGITVSTGVAAVNGTDQQEQQQQCN